MLTFTPLLACRGGVDIGPGLTLLIFATALLWLMAVIVIIPNALMSLRGDKQPKFVTINLVIFGVYLMLGLGMFTEGIFSVSSGLGVVSIFLVPLMADGHFIYLYRDWKKERERRRRSGAPGGDNSPALEKKSGE